MSDDAAVLASAAALVDAFGNHRTSDYFACFSEDATFVFHTHPTVLTSRAEYQLLWEEWERAAGFRVHSCRSDKTIVRFATADVAVFTHDVETDLSMDGERGVSLERETIVFRRTAGRWLAVHEHLSPRAIAPQAPAQ